MQRFRQFVSSFAGILAPLNQRLKTDQPKDFLLLNSEDLNAMKAIRAALITSLILALSYPDSYLTLDTDARKVQMGCVFLQKQPNDSMKPISN